MKRLPILASKERQYSATSFTMTLYPFTHRSLLLAGGVAMSACACSDQGPQPNSGPCSGDVAMTVSASLAPGVSWAPGCALSVLVIYPTSGQPQPNTRVVWDVATYGKNIIRSPVQYGVDPFAAVRGDTLPQATVAEPLVRGRTYQLTLFRAALDGSGEGFVAAQTEFTPPLPPRSSAQDPAPGTYVQLPPPGMTFPYSGDKMSGSIHADTLTVFSDLTYQSSGNIADPNSATPRRSFSRAGTDSLYFPRVSNVYYDMYARVRGDTLKLEADTVATRSVYSTVYVRH